jgi:hypothetical protein
MKLTQQKGHAEYGVSADEGSRISLHVLIVGVITTHSTQTS